MEKIEIKFVNNPYYYCSRLVCMITGYDIDDVLDITGKHSKSWRGKNFIDVFNQLGFQTSARFIKFDQEKDYPVLLRAKIFNDPSHWFVCVYYDGKCYIPGEGIFTFEDFENEYKDLKVTSMLKVWI